MFMVFIDLVGVSTAGIHRYLIKSTASRELG